MQGCWEGWSVGGGRLAVVSRNDGVGRCSSLPFRAWEFTRTSSRQTRTSPRQSPILRLQHAVSLNATMLRDDLQQLMTCNAFGNSQLDFRKLQMVLCQPHLLLYSNTNWLETKRHTFTQLECEEAARRAVSKLNPTLTTSAHARS